MANGSPSLGSFLFSFNGRIPRSAFWLKFVLPYFVITLVLAVVDAMLGTAMVADTGTSAAATGSAGILSGLFTVAAIWPGLAIYAKRWHDRNKSGWWTLIGFVPLIGALWMLIECGFLRGTAGSNRFGADPLSGAAMAAEAVAT